MSTSNEPAPKAGGDPMSGDDPQMLCDWCVTYPHSLAGARVSTPAAPAVVAVAVADCCNDGNRLDYLLCERHWAMLRDQPLPGHCPHCSAVADNLEAIVYTAFSLNGDDAILVRSGTVTEPVPAGRQASKANLPNAIRTSLATASVPEADVAETGSAAAVDDYDYVLMAEQTWGGGRQRAIDEAYNAAANQITDLMAQRARAHTAGESAVTAQLDHTIATLTYQRDHAAHAATDALKRDRQAFAMWRQTPDGQYFVDWVQRTFTMTTWIAATNNRWDQAWDSAVATISAEERAEHARSQWIDRPRRHQVMRWTRDIAVVVALIGLVAAVVMSPMWWTLAGAAVVAGGYAGYAGRDKQWDSANALAGRKAHERRVERFGFDPLDEPDRHAPNWATTQAMAYAHNMQQIALAGFETHPTPDALPEPVWPTWVSPDTVVVAELRAILRPPGR